MYYSENGSARRLTMERREGPSTLLKHKSEIVAYSTYICSKVSRSQEIYLKKLRNERCGTEASNSNDELPSRGSFDEKLR